MVIHIAPGATSLRMHLKNVSSSSHSSAQQTSRTATSRNRASAAGHSSRYTSAAMDPSNLHRIQRSSDQGYIPYSSSVDAAASTTAQERHRAQMASYRRNSDAGNSRSGSRTLHSRLEDFLTHFRPSRIDADEKRSRPNRPFPARGGWSILRSRRVRRLLFYIGFAALIYLFYRRPYSSSHIYPVEPATLSNADTPVGQATVSSSSPKIRRRQPRVPLPPAIMRSHEGDHVIRNGLLEVNLSSSAHPIHQLIREARSEWDAKNARQSRTLREAVDEYKRRHRRSPPRGFDKWWQFIVENNVQLPDEYDQIERDMLPFRALSPDELRLRNDRASQLPDTYTLKIRKGSVRTSVTFDPIEIHGADERMDAQVALLQPVAKYLEDMQAVYSVHDTPSVIVGWNHRRELLEHVEDDEYIDANDEIDLTPRGWAALCSPHSPIRREDWRKIPQHRNTSRTFISSHSKTMDICQHPGSIPLHGVLSGKEPHVSDILPLFSLAKTNLHADILGIPTESYLDEMDIIPWTLRINDRLLWRGSNTGSHFDTGSHWKLSHRIRLLDLTMRSEGDLNILPPRKTAEGRSLGDAWLTENTQEANEWYTDIAFSGNPLQCDEGVCETLREKYGFFGKMTHEEALHHKYVLDVDGNAWSARFQRLLKSGSVVFKSTIMPEWWTDRIQPWIHYVPVQIDYSDLYDALAFFRGAPSHPDSGETALAEEIARAARDYVSTHWRRADMTAYIFRLYLEWARLLAPRRWEMDFVYSEDMELARG